nr:hypothetical protein [uncultured Sphaerochaeta sp.]
MDGNNTLSFLVLHNIAELVVQVFINVTTNVTQALFLKCFKFLPLLIKQGFNLACLAVNFLFLE